MFHNQLTQQDFGALQQSGLDLTSNPIEGETEMVHLKIGFVPDNLTSLMSIKRGSKLTRTSRERKLDGWLYC